jgi:hypothetical protein
MRTKTFTAVPDGIPRKFYKRHMGFAGSQDIEYVMFAVCRHCEAISYHDACHAQGQSFQLKRLLQNFVHLGRRDAVIRSGGIWETAGGISWRGTGIM